MSLVLQGVVVGVLVAACALYSAWRLLSVRLRLRVLAALSTLPRAVTAPWLEPLKARTLARLPGGCAGCGGGAATPGAVPRNQTPGALRR
jgi:Family of unknown function (DUF6587)